MPKYFVCSQFNSWVQSIVETLNCARMIFCSFWFHLSLSLKRFHFCAYFPSGCLFSSEAGMCHIVPAGCRAVCRHCRAAGAGGETLVNGTRALPRESCCLLPTLSRPPPATGEKPVAGAALERPAQQPNSGSGSRSSSSGGGEEEKQQVAPGREQPGRKGLLWLLAALSRDSRAAAFQHRGPPTTTTRSNLGPRRKTGLP